MVKHEEKAIKFLQTVGINMNDLYLGFSGGKDSVVIYDLAKRSGIKFTTIYSNTTIDPPGTMRFIREHFPDVEIHQPKESFFSLVRRKGLPTRQTRFCCEVLKEQAGIGRNTILGVRSAESRQRQGRDYIQCDNRKSQKGAKLIYPIYDWSDDDVWDYIKRHKLPIAPCYHDGCVRLGCVACPLTSIPKRKLEYSLYPKFYDATKKAIGIGMQNNPQWKLTVATDGDAEVAMKWWLSNRSINQYFTEYKFEKTSEGWVKFRLPNLFE